MNLHLEGKRALVTGSTAGIGRAIVLALAAEGVSTIIHGRNQGAALLLKQEVEAAGGNAEIHIADMTDQASLAGMCAYLEANPVDILINNAGRYERLPWMQSHAGKWREMFESDLFSMVELTQAAIPPMRARGWGRIVQISSIVGLQPYALGPDYGAVKSAMLSFTVSLAKELARTGVTSNAVSPGPTLTATYEELIRGLAAKAGRDTAVPFAETERWAAENVAHIPLGRFARVEEVASLVTFLCSTLTDFVTGSNYHINGGQYGGLQ